MAEAFGVVAYNDPKTAEPVALMADLARAKTPMEANGLAYKAVAVGKLLKAGLLPAGGRSVFGALTNFGNLRLRLDLAVERGDGKSVLVRCLSKGEKLHPEEHGLWCEILRSDNVGELIFAFDSELDRGDNDFIGVLRQISNKVKLVKVKPDANPQKTDRTTTRETPPDIENGVGHS